MPSILITGASSGLSAEMARQFAELGYDLALCAHPDRRVLVKALDVTDHDAVFVIKHVPVGVLRRMS